MRKTPHAGLFLAASQAMKSTGALSRAARSVPKIIFILVSIASEASPQRPHVGSTPDGTNARAQATPDDQSAPEPSGTAMKHPTARAVESAPKPHDASGLAIRDPAEKPGSARIVGRLLLTVPRWGFSLAMQPVRGAVWAYERYQLRYLFKRAFYNEARTFGVLPVFLFETGFGFNAGGRFVYRDLFGRNETLRGRVVSGGRYQRRYSVTAGTGDRLQRVRFEVTGEIDGRNRERFAGIGDRDLGAIGSLMVPIDPLGDGPVVESRYRQQFRRLWGAAHISLAGPFSAVASAGILDRKFSVTGVDAGTDPVVSEAYDVNEIPGFIEGSRLGYAEIELSFTNRRPSSRYTPKVWWSAGWSLHAFAGYAEGLAKDRSQFFRYGGDLSRYINLFDSSRVLVLRAYGEGVSELAGERVPFSELPTLGGTQVLRGYPNSRFRDQYVATASAEYQFDLNAGSYGYLFVDTGKATQTIDAFATHDLRIGFGGGIQLNSLNSSLSRILVAGSKDGDFLLSLTFSPQLTPPHRFDRR